MSLFYLLSSLLGVGPTIARETPSYAIYFVLYGLLMKWPVVENLGVFAPLFSGPKEERKKKK
jgi:hypothetical protein